jgi:hypothetical protein
MDAFADFCAYFRVQPMTRISWGLLALLGLTPGLVKAQPAASTVSPLDSLRVGQRIAFTNPGLASADPNGVLFIADARQNIVQLSPAGQRLLTYSMPTRGHLAALDAGITGKVLAFYDDRQQITLFDRFLSPIATLQLSDYPETATALVRAATLAPDGTIWLFDERDLALLHLDPRDPGSLTRVPLDLLLTGGRSDIRGLRMYQNRLYLLDRTSGVYVFDIFGAFSRKLPLPGLNDLQFSGDELLILDEGGRTLRTEPLYSPTATPLRWALPTATVAAPGWTRVVAGLGGRVYLITSGEIGFAARP